MSPYLALARSAPAPAPSLQAGEADVSIDRLSSIVGPEPESANNNSAKKKWRRRQQPQRRPGGSSRSVCLRAPRESARLVRARDGSEDGERCRGRIGLAPKQSSSGGKDQLGNIRERGDHYLRSLFITGALAVIRQAKIHGTKHRPCLTASLKRRPTKVAAIALASVIFVVPGEIAGLLQRIR